MPGAKSALAVLLCCVALVLVAQFALSGWAESTDLDHDIQHGLIFFAGAGAGGAVVALWRAGRHLPR